MKTIEIYTGTDVRGTHVKAGKICYALWTLTRRGEARIGKTEAAEGNENLMELLALEKALERVREPCEIHVFTRSSYVSAGWDAGWLRKWEESGWKTSKGKDVQYADTWKRIEHLAKGSKMHFHVKEPGRLGDWIDESLKERKK